VEGRNFEIRKRLLEFDLVMARQREAIYGLRNRFLLPSREEAESLPPDDLDNYFDELFADHAQSLVDDYAPAGEPREEWNLQGLGSALAPTVDGTPVDLDAASRDELHGQVIDLLQAALTRQKSRLGTRFAAIARYLVLTTTDEAWLAHLYTLDDLREGIGWTAYGGTDPLIAFKRESFALFQEMLGRAATKIVRSLLSARLSDGGATPQQAERSVRFVHPGATPALDAPVQPPRGGRPSKRKPTRHGPKIGRNDPCPCGSGKKYKNCCGRNA
jgi:preprotein translocase subunit SecA